MLEINNTSRNSVEIIRGKESQTLFTNTSDVTLTVALCSDPLLPIHEIAEKLNESKDYLRS
jgi:hypothetical protein